jgi:DNA (cytosine-5)-methyltransferase 1
MKLTYAELFAGAGGLSTGLELAGWEAVAHAEIEPHARAVLRRHWPDVRLDGDVSALDGAEYRGITLLSGGSPCQDLSIAGKREGLSGRRSGLFFHQVRIWQESGAPLLLWENVVGALSSNQGKDFARILSTIIGEPVAVPRDGKRKRIKWSKVGAVQGAMGITVAWRVLDLRRFGVPQRRRRVFILASRTERVDPREVLLDAEGVRGHPQAFAEARQADPRAAAVGVAASGAIGFHVKQDAITSVDAIPALGVTSAGMGVVAFKIRGGVDVDSAGKAAGKGYLAVEGEVFTLGTAPDQHIFDARAVNISGGVVHLDPEMGTLGHRSGDSEVGAQTRGVVFDARGNGEGGADPTLAGDHQNRVTDYTAIVVPTLSMGAHPAAPGLNGQDAQQFAEALMAAQPLPRPRRLTPRECERLMGWPDDHTTLGVNERGEEYALSDTARYKLCGNGVASPVAAWIGHRIKNTLEISHGQKSAD